MFFFSFLFFCSCFIILFFWQFADSSQCPWIGAPRQGRTPARHGVGGVSAGREAPLLSQSEAPDSVQSKARSKPSRVQTLHARLADDAPLLVLGLAGAAADRLLLDVHEVAVHAGPARARRDHAVRFADVLHLLALHRLAVQHVAVLHGHLPVQVGAHLVGQLGQREQRLEHLVHVLVALGRDLEVGALLVAGHQLLDVLLLHLAVELAVALVAADDQRHVDVLLDLVLQTRLGLEDLPLEPLDLLEGVPVVQAEDQDEDVTFFWEEGRVEGEEALITGFLSRARRKRKKIGK